MGSGDIHVETEEWGGGMGCGKVGGEITVPAGTTGNQVDVILNELMRRINDAIE